MLAGTALVEGSGSANFRTKTKRLLIALLY